MGNQSEKKILKHKSNVIIYYQAVLAISTFLYLIVNAITTELFSFSGFFYFAFLLIVNLFTFKSINYSLENGLPLESYSLYLDIFALNSIVMIGSCIWSGTWYLYWIIPGNLLWKLLKWIWGYATNVEYVEEEKKKSKKQEKQEKKEKKEKVKYVKY